MGIELLIMALAGLAGAGGMVYQNTMNRRIAREQQNYDLMMWNRMNQYNNPTAQMERLINAGLNPNLVYGSGNVTGNTVNQPLKARDYGFTNPIPDPLQVLGQYTGIERNREVTDATRVKKNLDEAKIITEGTKNINLLENVKGVQIGNKMKQQLYDYNIDNYKQKLEADRQIILLRKKENELKAIDLEMEKFYKKYGLSRKDPAYYKLPAFMSAKFGGWMQDNTPQRDLPKHIVPPSEGYNPYIAPF